MRWTARRKASLATSLVAVAFTALAWIALADEPVAPPSAAVTPVVAASEASGPAPAPALTPAAAQPAPRRRAAYVEPTPVAPAAPVPVAAALVVVDPDGAPVEGVLVEWESHLNPDCKGPRAATDAEGRVRCEFAPDEERAATIQVGATEMRVALDAPETRVVVPFPRLEVEVVEAATGRAVSGSDVTLTLWHRAHSSERKPGADARRAVHLPRSWRDESDFRVEVTPPAGLAAVRTLTWEHEVAPQARRVVYTFPVWPETERSFRGVDGEGRPIGGVDVHDVELVCAGGSEAWGGVTHRAAADGGAVVTLRGLPAIPANSLRVEIARTPDDDGRNGWKGATQIGGLADAVPDAPTDVVLEPWDGKLTGFGCGGCGSGIGCGGRRKLADPVAVEVRVVRADGTAAAGVPVRLGSARGTTDASGVVTLQTGRGANATVVAQQHGFRPAVATVTGGRDVAVTLQEPRARTVVVTVLDESGRPAPGAFVRATSLRVPGPDGADVPTHVSVAQLDGDTEFLAPRTGPDGTLRLAVTEGDVRYDVKLAGAAASCESRGDAVEIRLR